MNIRKPSRTISINKPLLSALLPTAIDFKPKDFMLGETHCRTMAITGYPSKVDFGWLSKICKIDGVMVKISIDPTDSLQLINKINSSVNELKVRIDNVSAKKASTRERLKQQHSDAMKLLKKIDMGKESVCFLTVVLLIHSESMEGLNSIDRAVKSTLAGMRITPNTLVFQQEQGYLSSTAFHDVQESIKEVASRNIPVSTIAASMPWVAGGLSDPHGMLLGKDSNQGIISLDLWQRGNDRTNANMIFVGAPGSGKSSVVKHIILNEYARGTNIIIIDPESEYTNMAKELGQSVYDMSGTGLIINPLQIREVYSPETEENLLQPIKFSALSHHIKSLRTVFKLAIQDMTPIRMGILEVALEEVYAEKKIFYDTDVSELKADQYPVMSDLYQNLETKLANTSEKTDNNYRETQTLKSQIRSMVHGADRELWNGITNIKFNSQMVVLDINKLQGNDDVTRRTQYHNCTTWAWQQVLNNHQENMRTGSHNKILIVIDEAYIMVDKNAPESLIAVRNIAKRIRKRSGGLLTVTHAIHDYLDDNVKQYGQDLLDAPTFKLFLGTDGQNLEDITSLYRLNDGERELLAKKERGVGLFIAGSKRMQLEVLIDQAEFDLFGRAAGN